MGTAVGAFILFITTAVGMLYIPPAGVTAFVLLQFVGMGSIIQAVDTTTTDNEQTMEPSMEKQIWAHARTGGGSSGEPLLIAHLMKKVQTDVEFPTFELRDIMCGQPIGGLLDYLFEGEYIEAEGTFQKCKKCLRLQEV